METILQAILSLQFLFFCLAVGAVVFVVRHVIEYWMENWFPLKKWTAANKENKLWRNLILPILPIVVGVIGVLLAPTYPYPEGFNTKDGKYVFGLVAGFTSGFVVRLYSAFLSSKISELVAKVMPTKSEDQKSE